MRWLQALRRYLGAVRGGDIERVYAAASKNLSTGSWSVSDHSINDIVGADAATIRARVRQLVRDMPHAARAVDALTGLTVGTGIRPQPRVTFANGKLHKVLNQQIEDAWKRWVDEADTGGRMTFYELQALAKRSEIETGEFFFLRNETPTPAGGLPYRLQAVDPDRVDAYGPTSARGIETVNGVEFNAATGAAVAYHLSNDRLGINTVRVPAARVIHGFRTLRPGQVRGVSPLAPAVLLGHSLRDYLEAEIDSARMAARYLAFVTTPDPANTMAAMGAAQDASYTDSSGNHAKFIEEMGTAVKEYLAPGEDVRIAEHNRPGDSFTPFVRFVLQTLAAVTGISYEILSGNYEGLNYSVLRGIRNDLAKAVEIHQTNLINQLCKPVYRDFLSWAVMTGAVSIGDYFSNPWRYQQVSWLGPGMSAVDPLKEGRADVEAVKNLLKSPVEAIRARGRDPEDVLDEIAQFDAMVEDRGLSIEPTSGATQTNPAALNSEAEDADARLLRVVKE